jgi:hypothetical protein
MNEIDAVAVLQSPQVNLDRWGVHVWAALAASQSLRAYARAQGVSRHRLYATQTLMWRRGECCVPVSSRRQQIHAATHPARLSHRREDGDPPQE